MNHSFVVGESYQDRVGTYTVKSVDGNCLLYEYVDGIQHDADPSVKWRIHKNMFLEQGVRAIISKREPSHHDAGFFTHAEVFPIIANAIDTYSSRHFTYMTHEEIVEALITDGRAQDILERRVDKSQSWSASVMVAWFSKIFTDGTSEWDARFERKKIGLAWAYRVRKSGTD